jgi:hypothetical protein
MFIRDSSGNPNQISKVFVRDASGVPQEISKIYVRDASGNPILVFDNTVTTFACPECDTGYSYYFTIGTNTQTAAVAPFYTAPRAVFSGGSCNSTPQTQTPGFGDGYLPQFSVDKSYWSKIAVDYDTRKQFLPTEEKTYYFTTEETLSCLQSDSSCLCNWLNNLVETGTATSPTTQAPNQLYSKLVEAFNLTTNYPPLPGYIITDYRTTGKKSSVWALANIPQIEWNNHGTEVDVDSYFNVCGLGNLKADGVYAQPIGPRSGSIYPMYQRPVWLAKKFSDRPSVYNAQWFCKELGKRCGQEYCLGMYGDFYFSWATNPCWFNGSGGWQYHLYQADPSTPWSTFSCNPQGSGGTPGSDISGWEDHAGSTSLGSETFCIERADGTDWCITYECKLFFGGKGWDITDWNNINPFSWILAKEKTNTSKAQPVLNPGADSDDCCIDCLYGPVPAIPYGPADEQDTTCRNIYQIPPINSLDPHKQKFSFLSESSFDQQNVSIGIASGVAFNTNNEPGPNVPKVKMRFVLPAYVTLSNNLIGKIVKMKEDDATLNAFINSGPYSFETDGNGNSYFDSVDYFGSNGVLNEDDFSVWKAICSFLGFSIKDAIDGFEDPLHQKYRTFISSTAFYYEENRFDGDARLSNSGHPLIPAKGISTVTSASSLGQYPLLWWGFNGFPTEKHTHYVVVELEFSSATACQSYLTGNMRQIQLQPHNLKLMIKGMQFYPLHKLCKNLQGITGTVDLAGTQQEVTYAFRHPVFENYLVLDSNQKRADVFTNTSINDAEGGNGFIDYYANNLNLLTPDQGGTAAGKWNTTSSAQASRQRILNYFTYGVKPSSGAGLRTMYASCLSLPRIGPYSEFLTKYYAAGTVI